MRGKTNILPMVGGYINAPIQNETAGETLQLGDLVQRSYSDAPQQINQTLDSSVYGTLKPLKMFDGKYVFLRAPSTTDVDIKVTLVEKSVSSFIYSIKTLFSVATNYGIAACLVPIDNRKFVIFARTGYGNESYPYVYYCKKIVYDGVDFTATDITYDNFPSLSNSIDYKFSQTWCFGNGGTLFTASKIYYLTYDDVNDSISVYGGTTDTPGLRTFANPKILYFSQQDLFLCFVGYMGEQTISYYAIKFSNGSLVANSLSSDVYCPEIFGNYIVGFRYKVVSNTTYYKILIGTVDNSGNITLIDTIDTDMVVDTNAVLALIVPYQDYFVVICKSTNGTYFRVYYYNSGFVEGDKFFYQNSVGTGCASFDIIAKGFVLDAKAGDGTFGAAIRMFYQEMKGDKFASDSSNYVMVKAISKIEGVVKRGGNTGDTVEIFVPQISS